MMVQVQPAMLAFQVRQVLCVVLLSYVNSRMVGGEVIFYCLYLGSVLMDQFSRFFDLLFGEILELGKDDVEITQLGDRLSCRLSCRLSHNAHHVLNLMQGHQPMNHLDRISFESCV